MLYYALMEQIASEEVLQHAYEWLCERRKGYSANNDVWDLRWRWEEIKLQVQEKFIRTISAQPCAMYTGECEGR